MPWHRRLRIEIAREQAAVVVGVVPLYGASIEFGQYFRRHRHFDVNDILANTIGASLVVGWYVVRPYVEVVSVRELLSKWESSGSTS